MSIKEIYRKNLSTDSDVREHLGILRGLAMDAKTVTEFGLRTGVSTSAFLMGGAKVTSYDVSDCAETVAKLKKVAKENFVFHRLSSLEATIAPTDLLFVDSDHTYDTLRGELFRHQDKVSKWLVLHDTETFKTKGKRPNTLGLQKAIDEFLAAHSEWKLMLHLKNCNGLTILERVHG